MCSISVVTAGVIYLRAAGGESYQIEGQRRHARADFTLSNRQRRAMTMKREYYNDEQLNKIAPALDGMIGVDRIELQEHNLCQERGSKKMAPRALKKFRERR